MAFSTVKNVRIKSLTQGAVVELRFGKAAVKSADDTTITAKFVRHYEEGEKAMAVFEETDGDGAVSETVISRFPGAAWRSSNAQYVSLVGVDETTFTIQKAPGPVQTDSIAEAIAAITKEADDIYASDKLIALLTEIKDGKRINVGVKEAANLFSAAIVAEIVGLPDREAAAA